MLGHWAVMFSQCVLDNPCTTRYSVCMQNKCCRRYRFEGIDNFRDLGGYECDGGVTNYGVFYRSTELSHATNADIKKIADLGIAAIVDLRHPEEVRVRPDNYPKSCVYKNINVQGSITPAHLNVHQHVENTCTLWHMYKQLLTFSGAQFRTAIEFLATVQGPALFHCFQGKDRTGLVALFLCAIVGVDEKDCIADYEVSHTYVKGRTTDVTGSCFKNMENLLAFLHKTYGGVKEYLFSIGVAEKTCQQIRDKFIRAEC